MVELSDCRYCEEAFSNNEALTSHLASNHDTDELRRIDQKRVDTYLLCSDRHPLTQYRAFAWIRALSGGRLRSVLAGRWDYLGGAFFPPRKTDMYGQ